MKMIRRFKKIISKLINSKTKNLRNKIGCNKPNKSEEILLLKAICRHELTVLHIRIACLLTE